MIKRLIIFIIIIFSLSILYIGAGILFLLGAVLTSLIFNVSPENEADSVQE